MRSAGPDAAARADRDVALVRRPVAVVVHAVAGQVVRSRGARRAAVLDRAGDAGGRAGRQRRPRPRSSCRPARSPRRPSRCSCRPRCCRSGRCSRGARRAAVLHRAGRRRRSCRTPAGADAAARADRDVALVGRPVAVVVDAVAGQVARSRGARRAAVLDQAADAEVVPVAGAGPDAAARADRDVALVRRPVAVVVDAVAGQVARSRGARRAAVLDRAGDAEVVPRRAAQAPTPQLVPTGT